MADVWITWCRKRSKCYYCGQPIIAGTPMVKVKHWRVGRWAYYQRFHPECYITQGIARLQDYKRSKRLDISEEQMVTRGKLLRRYAATKVRLNKATDELTIKRILLQMLNIKEEIVSVGGVPKKWE